MFCFRPALNYDEGMVSVLMAAPGGQGSIFGDQLVLILVIFSIFYFIVFRPMRKRQREMEQMLEALKNDENKTLEKVKLQKVPGQVRKVEKDW